MNPNITEHTGSDRISALPEPIIHHILSFLTTEDVKVTSSVSKTWYRISNSFPFLDFDLDYLPAARYFKFKPNEYLNYVAETLHKFHNHNELNLEIRRLTLTITFTPALAELLDSWISIVLQRGIHDLNLKIGDYRGHCRDRSRYYNLRQPVWADKSIKVVKLVGCSLLQSFPNNHRIISGSTNNLLKLCFENVLLDDVILSSIISTCPLIEELSIRFCKGIKLFQISNLRKLKTLEIAHNPFEGIGEMGDIVAPSLQRLRIRGPVKIRVIECPKLIDLDLHRVVLMEDFRFQDFLSRVSFTRRLSFSNLISLTRLVELKIDAPNLRRLPESNHFSIFPSMHNASYVMCHWYGNNTKVNYITFEDFLVVVRNFVSKASHLKKLNLTLKKIQPASIEDLDKRAVQPVVNIDHLYLFIINNVSEISYPDILDYVFWSCHPRTFSFLCPNNDAMMSIREVIGHHHQPCKLSRSWLPCLEEVRYVARDGSEVQLPMDGILYREIKLVFKW